MSRRNRRARSNYDPHQNKGECNRRLDQIAHGQLAGRSGRLNGSPFVTVAAELTARRRRSRLKAEGARG